MTRHQKREEIINMLGKTGIKQTSLAGVFRKSSKQHIWNAIHTLRYPTLQDKIHQYLIKKSNGCADES